MKKFSRSLKMVGVITLFFFTWSYLPLFQFVAYAAQEKQATKAQPQRPEKQPAEKLERILDDLKADTSKAAGKAAKNEDTTSEVESIKTHKAEIDAIDTDLKKEFADTEQKLKSAHLPKEILDRHYKFVKNYETNLADLKANLDAIEKAKTRSALTSDLAKTEKQLSKIKPPKKRKPFDPNKLPNRLVKGKARQPRLKKEEFEKDFPPRKTKKAQAETENLTAAAGGHARTNNKPIILAYNGPASDLPILASSTDLPAFQIAQAGTSVDPADLAETPDILFTPEIKAKAQELEYKPLKIYEWVRNNIEYAPTYGSIQGANMCLQSKICNDVDTASLLIALLRASNISAHYVYGTIELPIDKAENWVGGVTDPNMVGTILATNGIPAKVVVSGGAIKAVQLEHVWVSAWINYIPSRGAVHRPGHEDTWIPLDASFKQYNYTQGVDLASAVPFDAQSFANQLLSTATTNTTEGSVTNVNSSLVQQTIQNYQAQVQNYIQQNYPNATVGDVIGKKEIVQKNYPILLGTLPYKTVQVGATFAQVPDNLRETVSFSIPDPTGASAGLTYSTGMPQIAGRKITLSFSPATANDEAVIESLLPQPNPDGTPLDPSQLPSSFPAYLINFVPELRIDGQVVATGASEMMGTADSLTVALNEPGIGVSNVETIIKAGEYFAIGLDTGRIGNLDALQAKLASTKTNLDSQNYNGLSKDDLVGDLLYTTIATYFGLLDVKDDIAAKTQRVIRYRAPSVGFYSMQMNVHDVFGVPTSASPQGMLMDVKRIMQAVFSKDGSMDKIKQFMLTSGGNSSMLEHLVPEQLFSTPANPVQGISAVKALQIANNQGQPVYTINKTNITTVLPNLQVSDEAKNDIVNAVNAGKQVTVSKSNITFNGWSGCGYVVVDPITGAGAYMISGSVHGGWCDCAAGGWTSCDVLDKLSPILGYLGSLAGIRVISRSLLAAPIANYIGIGLSAFTAIATGVHAYNQTNCLWNGVLSALVDVCFSVLSGALMGLTIAGLAGGPIGILLDVMVVLFITYLMGVVEEALLNMMNEESLCTNPA